jgi:hypothetical protein
MATGSVFIKFPNKDLPTNPNSQSHFYASEFIELAFPTAQYSNPRPRFVVELGRAGFGRRFDCPKLLGVRLLHQAFVVALDDVRAVASPRGGFALVLETRQMV